jgi:hypothetical protein
VLDANINIHAADICGDAGSVMEASRVKTRGQELCGGSGWGRDASDAKDAEEVKGEEVVRANRVVVLVMVMAGQHGCLLMVEPVCSGWRLLWRLAWQERDLRQSGLSGRGCSGQGNVTTTHQTSPLASAAAVFRIAMSKTRGLVDRRTMRCS